MSRIAASLQTKSEIPDRDAGLGRFGFRGNIIRKHPSRDVIIFGQILAQKMPNIIISNDVLIESLKQVISASRHVIISGQICGLKLQRVFT